MSRKIKKSAMKELELLFKDYEKEVKDSGLATSTQDTMTYHSGNFLKWLNGKYKVRKKK